MYFKQFRKRTVLLAVLGILLFIIMPIPFESVVVPEWKIKVVDSKGNPVPNKEVTQRWQHYSLESMINDHYEKRQTNNEGIVVFPERTIKASLLRRCLAVLAKLLVFLNPHASFGPYSYILSDGKTNDLYYEGGEIKDKVLIVEP